MADDLFSLSATALARDIRRGVRSPVEVIERFIERIEARNDRTNAFVHLMAEEAFEAARDVEAAVEAGRSVGPLAGVPLAVKDLEAVAGQPLTYGSVPFADHVAERDEPWVTRVREAGAILTGKTNTPEYGHKGVTDNRLFGPTCTPFDLERNAGGSSGGSAAAVADGLVPLAQGSDGGGSIRIPSSCCGIFGMMPTYRRVPRRSRPNAFSHTPFSQLGPHARTVEDAALLLSVMVGPHPSDPMSAPADGTAFLEAIDEPIDGFDVAYSPDLDVFPVDERVIGVIEDSIHAFEDAGASIECVELDHGIGLDSLEASWRSGFEVNYAALAEDVKGDGVNYLGADRDDACPEFVDLIEMGRATSAVDHKRQDNVRTTFFESVQRVFDDHDLIVTPTLAIPPVPNAAGGGTVGPSEVNGVQVDPLVGWCLTYPFNMTGHPVASVPAGHTDGGLPVGLQVVGRRWADDDVIAASAAFERVRPWHDAYPT